MPNIIIKDLGISYFKGKNEILVFEHLNCSFLNEKINVILGESGSGKTTLLRAIMGLIGYAGDIYYNEENVNKIPPYKRNIGYVSQEYGLYSHLNIFDNIAQPLKNIHASNDEIKMRVLEIAKLCKISDCLFVKPKYLSIGQKQRVAIARAIVKIPPILILDEPFSNLDNMMRLELRMLVSDLVKKYRITTLYVTHLINEATTIGDTFTIINGDNVKFFDDVKAFLNYEKE